MVNYQVVEAERGHVMPIAKNMRKADRTELHYSHGLSPEDAMIMGFERSDLAYTTLVDDKPCMMCGAVPGSLLAGQGIPWMLSTDDIYKIRFRRKEIELMQDYVRMIGHGFRLMENYVHNDNKMSIKWLKRMGFEMGEPQLYGVHSQPFRHFVMRIQ